MDPGQDWLYALAAEAFSGSALGEYIEAVARLEGLAALDADGAR